MKDFITLEKGSERYKSYMSGTFSKDHIATPVRSYNVSDVKERVTFQVQETPQIGGLQRFAAFVKLMRLELLAITWGPVFAVYSQLGLQGSTQLTLLFTSLFFVHAGVFSLNDYFDYISGRDPIRKLGGTRVLVSGYVRPVSAMLFGFFLLAMGGALAAPILLKEPRLFIVTALAGFFALKGPKYERLGVSIFLTFGPLLVIGLAMALSIVVNKQNLNSLIVLSLFSGATALLYFHSRQLSSVMDDHMSKYRTFATYFGFDRTRIYLMFEVLVVTSLYLSVNSNLFNIVFAMTLSVSMLWAIYQSKTPVSSFVERLSSRVLVYISALYVLLFLSVGT